MASAGVQADVPRAAPGQLLHQLLWLAPYRPVQRRVARSGLSHCGPYRVPQILCVAERLPDIATRNGIFAGERPSLPSFRARAQRARLPVYRQPPSPDRGMSCSIRSAAPAQPLRPRAIWIAVSLESSLTLSITAPPAIVSG